MPDPIGYNKDGSRFTSAAHQAHIEERQDERMRDRTELDNLKADTRTSRGKEVRMPWRIGRPLRPTGKTHESGPDEGYPVTPLELMNLHEAATPAEADRLAGELERVKVQDSILAGSIDHADQMGVELVEQELWWEAEEREEEERNGRNQT